MQSCRLDMIWNISKQYYTSETETVHKICMLILNYANMTTYSMDIQQVSLFEYYEHDASS